MAVSATPITSVLVSRVSPRYGASSRSATISTTSTAAEEPKTNAAAVRGPSSGKVAGSGCSGLTRRSCRTAGQPRWSAPVGDRVPEGSAQVHRPAGPQRRALGQVGLPSLRAVAGRQRPVGADHPPPRHRRHRARPSRCRPGAARTGRPPRRWPRRWWPGRSGPPRPRRAPPRRTPRGASRRAPHAAGHGQRDYRPAAGQDGPGTAAAPPTEVDGAVSESPAGGSVRGPARRARCPARA